MRWAFRRLSAIHPLKIRKFFLSAMSAAQPHTRRCALVVRLIWRQRYGKIDGDGFGNVRVELMESRLPSFEEGIQ